MQAHHSIEQRGVSRWRVIEEAKEKVSTLDLAERLCAPDGLRKAGKEWVGRCPLPDHEDKTPSFTVNSEKDLWWCHGCLRGGDVITLAQRAWEIDRADVAAAEILLTFGYEIPKRPDSWFRKQARQKPIRDAIEEVWVKHYQHRLYRGFFYEKALFVKTDVAVAPCGPAQLLSALRALCFYSHSLGEPTLLVTRCIG